MMVLTLLAILGLIVGLLYGIVAKKSLLAGVAYGIGLAILLPLAAIIIPLILIIIIILAVFAFLLYIFFVGLIFK